MPSHTSAAVLGLLSKSLFAPPAVQPRSVLAQPVRWVPGALYGRAALAGVVDYVTTPAPGRLVRVYLKASGALLRETVTAADGSYSFGDLAPDRDYYVVALDNAPSNWDTDISPVVRAQ